MRHGETVLDSSLQKHMCVLKQTLDLYPQRIKGCKIHHEDVRYNTLMLQKFSF